MNSTPSNTSPTINFESPTKAYKKLEQISLNAIETSMKNYRKCIESRELFVRMEHEALDKLQKVYSNHRNDPQMKSFHSYRDSFDNELKEIKQRQENLSAEQKRLLNCFDKMEIPLNEFIDMNKTTKNENSFH